MQLILRLLFLFLNSKATLFVNPIIADFVLAYPVKSAKGYFPTIDPIFTMNFEFLFLYL